jgi:hypothetical protein
MKASNFERKMRKEKRKRVHEEKEEETDTMDVYDEKQLEEMLENDEITEAEYSFMLGRERKKNKLGLKRREHEDTQSVELAKHEYEED